MTVFFMVSLKTEWDLKMYTGHQ